MKTYYGSTFSRTPRGPGTGPTEGGKATEQLPSRFVRERRIGKQRGDGGLSKRVEDVRTVARPGDDTTTLVGEAYLAASEQGVLVVEDLRDPLASKRPIYSSLRTAGPGTSWLASLSEP